MKKTKPCPFCKGEFLGCRMTVNRYDYLHRYVAYIFCHNCGAEGKKAKFKSETPVEEQVSLAVDYWNERYIEG